MTSIHYATSVLLTAGFLNVAAALGAGFASSQMKADGRVPQDTPTFFSMAWDPLGAQHFGRVYSDLHLDYASDFITACVWVMRIATPLFFVLAPVLFLAALGGH